MKKLFYCTTVTALIAGALSFCSCTEKDGQSPPKIVVEYPDEIFLGINSSSYTEFQTGDSIRLKYSVSDADNISSIQTTVKYDYDLKPLLNGIRPAPIYDKSYTNVGEKVVIDDKFIIYDADQYGRDKSWFLIEIVATDSNGNKFKYSFRIVVSSI